MKARPRPAASDIIKLLHGVLVLAVVVSPLVPLRQYKYYAYIFLLYLAFQYLTGYARCGLTELEYLYTGKEYQSGFIYRIITPIITVSEDYFDKYFYLVHLGYILLLRYQLNP